MTIREYIKRRKASVQIVVLIFWLPGVVMLSAGRRGQFTLINFAGIGALLVSGLIYLIYIGMIRCPKCREFIGLSTVSMTRDKSNVPDRCIRCGASFEESMDGPAK
jgi:hypothetical protein